MSSRLLLRHLAAAILFRSRRRRFFSSSSGASCKNIAKHVSFHVALRLRFRCVITRTNTLPMSNIDLFEFAPAAGGVRSLVLVSAHSLHHFSSGEGHAGGVGVHPGLGRSHGRDHGLDHPLQVRAGGDGGDGGHEGRPGDGEIRKILKHKNKHGTLFSAMQISVWRMPMLCFYKKVHARFTSQMTGRKLRPSGLRTLK